MCGDWWKLRSQSAYGISVSIPVLRGLGGVVVNLPLKGVVGWLDCVICILLQSFLVISSLILLLRQWYWFTITFFFGGKPLGATLLNSAALMGMMELIIIS